MMMKSASWADDCIPAAGQEFCTKDTMKTPTILIVEDEPHIAEVVALKLQQAQFRTIMARDGNEALAALDQQKVDLVIADVAMPGMSGLELSREIALRHKRVLPVILLTGISHASDSLDLENTHVAGVIAKPFSPKQLLARVLKALEEGPGPLEPKPAAAISA
jgi:DNA-binding response OmpR family regulator